MIAVYCRQSVEKRDSISISQQEEFCRRLFSGEDISVYSDRGYTGANTRRPGFEALMEDIRRGRISKVICYKVDRISRSLQDFVGIYGEFEKYGVQFISCSEQFDTSTAMGRATLQIIMVFAELERNMIRKRVRDNFYERGKKGLFLAGIAPFGFRKKPALIDGIHTKILEPDPERARAVELMYEDYLEGGSLGATAKKLNDMGYKTSRGNSFTSCSVSRILRNPVYVRADADVYSYLAGRGAIPDDPPGKYDGSCGCTLYGSRREKTRGKFSDISGDHFKLNSHRGLIDPEKWISVQRLLCDNRPVKNTGRGRNTWLTGLTVCGYCGKHITVVNGQKNGKRYMNCGGRKTGTCPGRKEHMTFDVLEKAMEACLSDRISRFDFSPPEETEAGSALNEKKIRLIEIREETEALMKKLPLAGDALFHYIDERIGILEGKRTELEAELIKNAAEPDMISAEDIRERLRGIPEMSFDKKRRIAHTFIKSIKIYDGLLCVFYR